MRQRSRTECLGKVAEIGAGETEPLGMALILSLESKPVFSMLRITYRDQEYRQSGSHSHHEDDSEKGRSKLGTLPKNVMDLGLLAVAEGLWDGRRRRNGIGFDFDVEGVGDKTL